MKNKRQRLCLWMLIVAVQVIGCGNRQGTTNKNIEEVQGEGYYIISDAGQILFYDNKKEAMVPLCSKEGCGHMEGDAACNANVSDASAASIKNGEDGKYLLSLAPDGTLHLERIKQDGTIREGLLSIESVTEASINAADEFAVWDGFLYFTVWEMQENGYYSMHMYRMRSDGTGSKELLYANEATGLAVSELKIGTAFEDRLYFSDSYYYEDDESVQYADLYCYDLKKQIVKKVAKQVYGEFVILDGKLYYHNDEEPIRRMDLATGEVSEFAPVVEKNERVWLFTDGTYLYTDNFYDSCLPYEEKVSSRGILVYDTDGSLKAQISLEGKENTVYYGDCVALLYQGNDGFYRLDKAELEVENAEWKAIRTTQE